ncbi:hypothetical protein BRAS3843_2840011 [Bradyrhizobium sp. STM 3843]|nr:hypothetical protein BRAS3843_2840011 [Bradyrhizobium sp. STM 3843]
MLTRPSYLIQQSPCGHARGLLFSGHAIGTALTPTFGVSNRRRLLTLPHCTRDLTCGLCRMHSPT